MEPLRRYMSPMPWTHGQMSLCLLNSAVLLHRVDTWLPACLMQFQVTFLDAAAGCEWKWFSKVMLSLCGYIDHGGMTVSHAVFLQKYFWIWWFSDWVWHKVVMEAASVPSPAPSPVICHLSSVICRLQNYPQLLFVYSDFSVHFFSSQLFSVLLASNLKLLYSF